MSLDTYLYMLFMLAFLQQGGVLNPTEYFKFCNRLNDIYKVGDKDA